MTTPEEPTLLDLPVGLAARRIARAFLDEARAAATRLDDAADLEALHDFRVAIRRLRATLRAWGEPLRPEITGRRRKALIAVQQATGDGRDAEVMLDWVRAQRDALPDDGAAGHRRFVARLEARKDDAYDRARGDVRKSFAAVDHDLRAQLSTMTRVTDVDHPVDEPSYAAALADAVVAQVGVLDARVRDAVEAHHAEGLHTARIDTKRLRYLVEPVRDVAEGASALVRQCKELQEVLGEYQDAAVLAAELRAADDSDAPAIDALTRLNRARADRLFGDVRTHWIGGALAGLVAAAEGFAATLRARGDGGAPVEIERKYLLTGLPPEAKKSGERAEMDQGYLPGEVLIERVRRVRTAHGERFVRTVKAGKGVRRVELEEPCDAATFAALWPLTEGRRVEKIRYAVADGDRLWEIDAFTDRELVLAEVELPHEDAEVVFPAWLAKYVDREVTDDGDYTNRRLSR